MYIFISQSDVCLQIMIEIWYQGQITPPSTWIIPHSVLGKWKQTCLLKHTHIQEFWLGRHCEEVKETTPLSRMREEELSRSLRGGSGAQFPTMIPSSCLPRLRKRTHSFVWFRSVFSPVLPRNQIARKSSLFLVYTKVYSYMCVYDVTHAYLSPNKNEIYWLTHTYTHTHRYVCYQGQSRTHGGPTLYSS